MIEYLVVCVRKGMATSLLDRLVDYITACYPNTCYTMTVNKRCGTITNVGLNTKIRFVIAERADEARRGFTGIVVSGYAVDKFLDPWERERN